MTSPNDFVPNGTRKAVIYSRSLSVGGNECENQIALCSEACANQFNLLVAYSIQDEGGSLKPRARPGYTILRHLVAGKMARAIVVNDIDQVFRKPKHFIQAIKRLGIHGVRIYSASEHLYEDIGNGKLDTI